MRVLPLNPNSPYLAGVKELWRKNSQTLGFFPEGAFNEHAERGWILAAISDSGDLGGYLLYRVVWRGSVWPIGVIVHLCVAKAFRHKGVSKILVNDFMERKGGSLFRVELRCRRDYEADKIWPHLGFVYQGDAVGRAGVPLTKWQIELRCLPLLALIEQNLAQRQILAVMDANVLYRLQDELLEFPPSEKRLSEEAKALEADWIDEGIGLYITDETLNEIQRSDDPDLRKYRLTASRRFAKLRNSISEVRKTEENLASFFSRGRNNRSDMRQIAHAIAGKAHFFITQDTGVLKRSEKLNEALAIHVVSPGEFISHLDERIREIEYKPEALAGSMSLMRIKVTRRMFRKLFRDFSSYDTGEKKNEFEGQLRLFLSDPERYALDVVRYSDKEDNLVLAAFDRGSTDELFLPLLRASRSRMAETVLRYLLRGTVITCAKEGRSFIKISDHPAMTFASQAFVETGFSYENRSWVKYNASDIASASVFVSLLCQAEIDYPSYSSMLSGLVQALSNAMMIRDSSGFSEIERQIWPGRISDANIRTYIIPIKPHWARNLFDEGLAREILWGTKDYISLLLMNENVYYRDAQSVSNIEAPARILWYVSKGSEPGTKCIRACSSLDEVIVEGASHLYGRFKRLGIYRWEDILKTAKGDPSGKIMALRFSSTQPFPTPVTLRQLRDILLSTESKSPLLQAPQSISPSSFSAIYSIGIRG